MLFMNEATMIMLAAMLSMLPHMVYGGSWVPRRQRMLDFGGARLLLIVNVSPQKNAP